MTPKERADLMKQMQNEGWSIKTQKSADASVAPGNAPDPSITQQWQCRADLAGVESGTHAGYGDTKEEAIDAMLSEYEGS